MKTREIMDFGRETKKDDYVCPPLDASRYLLENTAAVFSDANLSNLEAEDCYEYDYTRRTFLVDEPWLEGIKKFCFLDHYIIDNELFYMLPLPDFNLKKTNMFLAAQNQDFRLIAMNKEQLFSWDPRYQEVMSNLDLAMVDKPKPMHTYKRKIAFIGFSPLYKDIYRQLA